MFRNVHLQMFNMHGICVLDQPGAPVPVNLHLPHLPPGMYVCRIEEQDGKMYSFKVMKL